MSVYAGFGGQEFMPEVLDKIRKLREEHRYQGDILIDGGINKGTISDSKYAGENIFVAGSSIFGKNNRKKGNLNPRFEKEVEKINCKRVLYRVESRYPYLSEKFPYAAPCSVIHE